jgi:hypothetical protein
MSPEMYILINLNLFYLKTAPTTATPAYPIKYNPDGEIVPYTREEKSTINAELSMVKNYFETWKNIYQACYDMLEVHINNAFKVSPPITLPTWNATMSLCHIFDQLTTMYGKPTQDTMCTNNLTFLAVYNPQDPPKILFKQCTNCQEIATLAKNPYKTQQLLQNALDLIARYGLYQCDIEDWEQKPIGNQMWINLCPFIQEAYQQCLLSGTITSTQSGYAQSNALPA